MHRARKIGTWFSLALLLSFMAVGFTPVQVAQAQLSGNSVTYNLYATDGFMRLADGNTLYIYGFVGGRAGQTIDYYTSPFSRKLPETTRHITVPDPVGGPIQPAEAPLAGNAQFPAPIIAAAVGDVVEIRLKNLGVSASPKAPNDPHSIHLHGLDVDAANDGVPETSVGAVPANAALPGAGNVVVYMFTTQHPGTYMYHCHQEASIHVAMGMYGALVIYNQGEAGVLGVEDTPGSNDWRYGPGLGGGELYGWQYDKDYVLLLSDMDINQNRAEQLASLFNNVNYKPQYWFVNGLSFPSTIHVAPPGAPNANGAWWTGWEHAHHGYDPFITGSVSKLSRDGTPGEKVLLRVINMGFQAHPMHMHGFHGKIIGSDQRGWNFANQPGVTPFGQGMEKNTLLIGSGETYEWLLDFGQQAVTSFYAPGTKLPVLSQDVIPSSFPGGTQSKYNPVGNLPQSNTSTFPAIPDPFTPPFTYIAGPEVSGAVGHPAPSQLFPFHNHNDYQATNNGVYPGGMFTMIMTTP